MLSSSILVHCVLLTQVPGGSGTGDWSVDDRVPPTITVDQSDPRSVAPVGTTPASAPATFRSPDEELQREPRGFGADKRGADGWSDRSSANSIAPHSLDSKPPTQGRKATEDVSSPPSTHGGPLSAKEWIEELLTAPPEGALPGTPVTLSDSMQGVRGDRQQQEVIDTYWRLSKAVANYHVAAQVYRVMLAETSRFGQPGPGVSTRPVANLRLDAARARLEAIRAQADLAALIRWPGDDLPLPASRPHVGAYHTRYAEIFANQPNRQAKRLHYLLPNEVELIRAHAELLNVLASDTQGDAADAAEFRTECGQFLHAVDAYNRNIARYVLLASKNDSDGADIVPMLIKVQRKRPGDARVAGDRNSRDALAPSRGDSSQAVPAGNRNLARNEAGILSRPSGNEAPNSPGIGSNNQSQ